MIQEMEKEGRKLWGDRGGEAWERRSTGGTFLHRELCSSEVSDHENKIIIKMVKAEVDLLGMWNDIKTKIHQVAGYKYFQIKSYTLLN